MNLPRHLSMLVALGLLFQGSVPSPAAETGKPQAASAASVLTPILEPTTAAGLKINQSPQEIEFRSRWLRIVVAKDRPQITALSWDSLGKGDVGENLLHANGGQLTVPGATAKPAPVQRDGNVVRYPVAFSNGVQAHWEMRVEAKSLRMAIRWSNPAAAANGDPPALQLAFNFGASAVAPIGVPRESGPGPLPLPCIIHGSRSGGILVNGAQPNAGFVGGRGQSYNPCWTLSLLGPLQPDKDKLYHWPQGNSSWEFAFSVETTPLAAPELVAAEPRLKAMPRHWLNGFHYRTDAGILANNSISDTCANCLSQQGEIALYTPQLPGGFHAMDLVRASLDQWLAGSHGIGGYYGQGLMDEPPALLTSAWYVILATGDRALLNRWLPALERLASEWKKRDVDNNGLYEGAQSGNSGQWQGACNANDCPNFGHEDAYSLALGYRGLRYLADLERLAGRDEQAKVYDRDADRIRAAYVPTFFNPKTGILAGWKSRDGQLHDYWFTQITPMAIIYGLVPDELAGKMMDRLMAKLHEVGYTRFDLGLPLNLVPIAKRDYRTGLTVKQGGSVKEDGSDGFQNFVNGGTGAYSYLFLQALYQTGRRAEADKILWGELAGYAANHFQNGLGQGGELTRWDGTPSGYEGFLAHCYRDPLALYTGHWGIGFNAKGFYLEPWSPLKGKRVKLGLMYMGKTVEEVH